MICLVTRPVAPPVLSSICIGTRSDVLTLSSARPGIARWGLKGQPREDRPLSGNNHACTAGTSADGNITFAQGRDGPILASVVSAVNVGGRACTNIDRTSDHAAPL